jgi:hypothetical protein
MSNVDLRGKQRIARQGRRLAIDLGAMDSHFTVAGSKEPSVAIAPIANDNAARQIEVKTEKRFQLWPDMHDRYPMKSMSCMKHEENETTNF